MQISVLACLKGTLDLKKNKKKSSDQQPELRYKVEFERLKK